MPDQEFKLLITGDATGAVGASQQAGDSLRKLKVDCSDLSEETKRSLGIMSATGDEVKKLGGKTEETAEKMEKGGREVRHLGNELGKLLGISDLGAATMGKMGLAVFAVGAALEFLHSTYEEVQESIKGPIDLKVHSDPAQITAVAKSWDQYAEAIKKAHEASNSPEAAANRENQVLSQKLQLLKDILKAEEDEMLTALELKKDQMSPQAYAAAQQQIRTAFGHKTSDADDETERARIAAKEKEEANLRADAAEKKSKGEAMTTGNSDAQGAAKENAEKVKAALEEIDQRIELIKRYQSGFIKGGDVPEYMGSFGKIQEASDITHFYKRYGISSPQEALGIEQRRKTEAKAAIALGQRAEDQAREREEEKKKLLSQAGEETGKADELHLQVGEAKEDYNRVQVAKAGTEALAGAGMALTQEGNAEHNNTHQGLKDANAALAAGISAQQQVVQAVKEVGRSNTELHGALEKAFADLRAENLKLAARIKQMQFNTK